jgi:hypothetical protein
MERINPDLPAFEWQRAKIYLGGKHGWGDWPAEFNGERPTCTEMVALSGGIMLGQRIVFDEPRDSGSLFWLADWIDAVSKEIGDPTKRKTELLERGPEMVLSICEAYQQEWDDIRRPEPPARRSW